MRTLRLEVLLEYDDTIMHADDDSGREWFEEEVLYGSDLVLHCNNIGDTVGTVTTLAVCAGHTNKERDDHE